MPSGGAEKLLARMRGSKAGWTADDLDRLYKGYGVHSKQGGKYTLYIHPRFPELRATVTRHRSLPIGYVQTAIRQIERLIELEAETQQ